MIIVTQQMMCALYRHGVCLENQIGPEVTQTTNCLAKSVSDFGHVMNIISSLEVKGRVWGLFGTAACRPIVPLPQ